MLLSDGATLEDRCEGRPRSYRVHSDSPAVGHRGGHVPDSPYHSSHIYGHDEIEERHRVLVLPADSAGDTGLEHDSIVSHTPQEYPHALAIAGPGECLGRDVDGQHCVTPVGKYLSHSSADSDSGCRACDEGDRGSSGSSGDSLTG